MLALVKQFSIGCQEKRQDTTMCRLPTIECCYLERCISITKDQCLDAVTGATLFSTFELTSGYHQIPVKQEGTLQTAFVTKYGLFEFTTMPFGVCNGPATSQRLVELVLNGLQ